MFIRKARRSAMLVMHVPKNGLKGASKAKREVGKEKVQKRNERKSRSEEKGSRTGGGPSGILIRRVVELRPCVVKCTHSSSE